MSTERNVREGGRSLGHLAAIGKPDPVARVQAVTEREVRSDDLLQGQEGHRLVRWDEVTRSSERIDPDLSGLKS